jgi:hypothetical protein
VNYNTQEFDSIAPTVGASGSLSGISPSTGRILFGNITGTSISLTYNGAIVNGEKESLYGPTRQYVGSWRGVVSDPTVGFGFGQLLISSHGECLTFYLQDFNYNIGIGTITSDGAASVRLLSGVTISGTFSPANGLASGTFNYSTGGQNTYSFTKAVTARLANISTRGVVGTGQQVLIAGFIITDGGKTVLITAEGRTLAGRGVVGTVSNPKLDIFQGTKLIASNSSWKADANASEVAASGVAPTDDREAALQIDLEPGTYTAVVSSEDASTGIGLVEIYGVGSPIGY